MQLMELSPPCPTFVTTKQAAALLGVTVNTLRSCQARNQISATPETRGLHLGRGNQSLFVYADVVRLQAERAAKKQRRDQNQIVVDGKKRCSKCGKNLPVAQFHACSVARCGLYTWCKNCTSQINREQFASTNSDVLRAERAKLKRERGLILEAVADGKARHPGGFFLVKVESTGFYFARALNDPNRRTGKIIAQMQPVGGLSTVPPSSSPWSVYSADQWGVSAAQTAAWLLRREQRIYLRAGGQGHG